jgi:alkanesulfonate monooxygenase SsuD/methylene tetrahydromethanopterin reductase-like flavin-dependent oxidoreductase (luciferase family)
MRVGIYSDLRNPPLWRQPTDVALRVALERIQYAEAVGLDEVWLTEHHGFGDDYLSQPLTFAAAVAASTRRIGIGTAVLLAPLRETADIAEQAGLVDGLSGGRLQLGLGAGYRQDEFARFGREKRTRYETLDRQLAEIRELWASGQATPKPVQERLPIWVGAMGPRTARMAARHGEGLLYLDPAVFAVYRDAWLDHGHDPAHMQVAGSVSLFLADDPERTWAHIKPHLAYMWGTYAAASVDPPLDHTALKTAFDQQPTLDPETLRSPGPAMLTSAFDVVTPAEAVRRLQAWLHDMPVRSVFFWDKIAGMDETLVRRHLELLATEVAPAVADLGIPSRHPWTDVGG